MPKKNLFIGVMSGTSLDGVDIALCEINIDSCTLISSHEYPFPPELKKFILTTIANKTTLQEIGILDHKLGHLFAHAIQDFIIFKNINPKDINAIGLHGQTLWHAPNAPTPFSMQLGDANIVVAQTGIRTVADFRRMDIANGGEGAPFAPAFHKFLFASLKEKIAVLNIGGMANITILGENLRGWDVGCGNVLLDIWIHKTLNKSYDEDGAFAKSGNIDTKLLKRMLNDAYFNKTAPKSTGREYFNEQWLTQLLSSASSYKNEDIQRTLLELTAISISNDLKQHNVDKLIVCGGGAKNIFLMQRLKMLNSFTVHSSDVFGVNGDFLEAMAFAWFAYKRVNNQSINLQSVTGARKNSSLGAIYG